MEVLLQATHARGSFKIPANSYVVTHYHSTLIADALMGMHAYAKRAFKFYV